MNKDIISDNYFKFLEEVKKRVASSRYQAALSVNRELILLYHHIGSEIIKSQAQHGWGAKIIEQLSKDLRSAFPEMKGFSTRNLNYMQAFATSYPQIVQQPAAQLPWFHIITILIDCKAQEERDFYINKAIEHGWSRNILSMQIESKLYHCEGKAITNFHKNLPSIDSDLANATLKNPYLFDFLGRREDNPSIGLILCRSKLGIMAKYTLRDIAKPIALSEYKMNESLPANLKTPLPTIKELETILSNKIKDHNMRS